MFRHRFLALLSLAIGLLAPGAHAQWSPDPGVNLAIADKPGAQVQPKIRATPDGGCYVSWFDSDPNGSPPFGYDVYLQRLDRDGFEQWPHGGILIADRGFSSTEDYGLAVDGSGNALLTFRDDRFTGVQITAAKVEPSGFLAWGPDGVPVTSNSAGHYMPKIAVASDGEIVVAWTNDSDVVLQRLDAGGTPLWGPGVTVPPPSPVANLAASDLKASDNGAVILSWVHSIGFPGPRHLYANKIAPDGRLLWGADHVCVFDGGFLQIGNFPTFVSDQAGGAAFGWYGTDPLQSYAQRVPFDGTEAFPHDGALGSSEWTRDRTGPSVSFDPDTESTFLFWKEEGGSTYGLYGQRFDPSGARLWTDQGREISGLGPEVVSFVRNLQLGDGAMVFWLQERSFGQMQVLAARVDANGTLLCPPFPASSLLSGKSRLDADLTRLGVSLLAWSDERADPDGDIYVQNVNGDCSPGPGSPPSEVSPPGAGQPLAFTDKETLVWEEKSLSGSAGFNLYRGDLGELAGGACGSCLEPDIPINATTDIEAPSAGGGFFYLVTGENPWGEGPMGEDSGGNPRNPGASCP